MKLPEKFKFVVNRGAAARFYPRVEVYEAVVNGNEVVISWNWGDVNSSAVLGTREVLRYIEDGRWKIIEDTSQACGTGSVGYSGIYEEVMDFVSETDSSVTFSSQCFEVVYGPSCTSVRCKTLDELRAVMEAVRTLKKYGG